VGRSSNMDNQFLHSGNNLQPADLM
jgi:hypothetical protein